MAGKGSRVRRALLPSSASSSRSAALTSAPNARSDSGATPGPRPATPLLESLLIKKVQPEQSVLIPNRDRRPVLIQRPLHADDHLVRRGDVGDISERHVLAHLLLH